LITVVFFVTRKILGRAVVVCPLTETFSLEVLKGKMIPNSHFLKGEKSAIKGDNGERE
jgi:hypothetical protein